MSLMLEELLSAPKLLSNTINRNLNILKAICKKVNEKNISFITTVARGTSNHAANYFKHVCEEKTGIMVSKFNHSVATIGGKQTNLKNTLCLGISQSGTGQDTLTVMKTAKEQGALTVAITNYPDSPLATLCDYHIFLAADEEKSVAATKTFTLQIACLQAFALLLAKKELPDYDKISNQLNTFIQESLNGIKNFAQTNKGNDNMIILSRGEMFAFAEEASLKLIETCYKFSRPYSVAEFAHGPYALIEKGRKVVLIAPDSIYSKDYIAIVKRMKSDGADIFAITDIDEIIEQSNGHLKVSYPQDNPYMYIITLQAYAAFLSVTLNLNPDKPRGLNKITNTL